MNLRNNEITVGEVLSNPRARQLLQREIPMIMNHPMMPMANAIPLKDVITYTKGYVPKMKLNSILNQLEKL